MQEPWYFRHPTEWRDVQKNKTVFKYNLSTVQNS